jgi:hypothetical protein
MRVDPRAAQVLSDWMLAELKGRASLAPALHLEPGQPVVTPEQLPSSSE